MQTTKTEGLRKQFLTLRAIYMAYLIAAVIALVLFFIDKRLTLAALALSLVYHLVFVRPHAKSYEKAYIHACAISTLEQHLKDVSHTSRSTLDESELRGCRMIAANGQHGCVLLREGGSGTGHGYSVCLGDATIAHSFPMNGKKHHQFVTGCWIRVQLKSDTGLNWRALDRRVMMKASLEEMLKRETDLHLIKENGFSNDFLIIYAGNDCHCPPEQFLTNLSSLAGSTKQALAVCVQGRVMHLMIANRVLGQKVSIREAPDEKIVTADMLPELEGVIKLAQALDAQ